MSTISNRTSVYTAYTSDEEGNPSDAGKEKAKKNVCQSLQKLFDLNAATLFLSPILPLETNSIESSRISFQQESSVIDERLTSLSDEISGTALGFESFKIVRSDIMEEKKTELAKCVREETLPNDCLKKLGEGLTEAEKIELKKFLPNAYIGEKLDVMAIPFALISKAMMAVTKFIYLAGVSEGCMSTSPLNYRQCISETRAELENPHSRTRVLIQEIVPPWMKSVLEKFSELDRIIQHFDHEMNNEYRTTEGRLHEAAEGVIGVVTPAGVSMGQKVVKGAMKVVKKVPKVPPKQFSKIRDRELNSYFSKTDMEQLRFLESTEKSVPKVPPKKISKMNDNELITDFTKVDAKSLDSVKVTEKVAPEMPYLGNGECRMDAYLKTITDEQSIISKFQRSTIFGESTFPKPSTQYLPKHLGTLLRESEVQSFKRKGPPGLGSVSGNLLYVTSPDTMMVFIGKNLKYPIVNKKIGSYLLIERSAGKLGKLKPYDALKLVVDTAIKLADRKSFKKLQFVWDSNKSPVASVLKKEFNVPAKAYGELERGIGKPLSVMELDLR